MNILTIRHAFGSSESEVREALRTALRRLFGANKELYYDSNRYFERWIDIRPTSNASLEGRQNTQKFKEFTAFVYLTKTEYVEKVVTCLDDQHLPTWPQAPKPMQLTGWHVQRIKCKRCGQRGHMMSQCLDYVLRIETWSKQRQITPALAKAIKNNTKATDVITGHNNQGPCKHWGYIKFASVEDRNAAAGFLESLVKKRAIGLPILISDRGVLDECWRCGALDATERAHSRQPHKSSDTRCPLHPKRRSNNSQSFLTDKQENKEEVSGKGKMNEKEVKEEGKNLRPREEMGNLVRKFGNGITTAL